MERLPTKSLPPPANPSPKFCGRSRILQEIHSAISKTENETEPLKRLVVLCGIKGIGKKTVMEKYCFDHQDEYKNIFWINAQNEDCLKKSFLLLADHLNISRKLWNLQAITQSKSDLSSINLICEKQFKLILEQIYLNLTRKTLLIFLDANDITTDQSGLKINEYLPSKSTLTNFKQLNFVVTSTRLILGNEMRVIPIIPFNGDEVVEYFEKCLEIDCELESFQKQLKKLGNILNGHPMALNLASAFLNFKNVLIQNPLKFQYKVSEFIEKVTENSEDFIKSFFDYILTEIEKESKVAMDLVQIFAFLPSHELTVDTCQAIYSNCVLRKSTSFGDTDLIEIRQAIRVLEKFSILETISESEQNEPNLVRMHSLVKQWMRESLKFSKKLDFQFLNVLRWLKVNMQMLPRSYWTNFGPYLKDYLWPEESWQNYLHFIVWDFRFDKKDIKFVKDIYNFLKTRKELSGSAEYSKLCQIILVFEKHKLFKMDLMSMNASNVNPECRNVHVEPSFVYDNLELFERSHVLGQIRADELLSWILDEAIKYEENDSFQMLALHLILTVRIHLIKDDELKSKFATWTLVFCNALQRKDTMIDNRRAEMFLGIYKMQNVLCAEVVYLEYIVQTLEIRIEIEDHFNCCQLLTDALSNVFHWPPMGIWKSETFYKAEYSAGSSICKLFLTNGGLNVLTQLLVLIQREIRTELSVTGSEVFDKVINLACYRECAWILLNSDEFKLQIKKTISELNNQIILLIGNIENNVDRLHYFNYLDKILVTWFSLFMPKNQENKGNSPSPDYLAEEMENCAQIYDSLLKLVEGLNKEERRQIFMYTDWFTSKYRLNILSEFLSSRNKSVAPISTNLAKQAYNFYLLFRPKWRRRLQIAFDLN